MGLGGSKPDPCVGVQNQLRECVVARERQTEKLTARLDECVLAQGNATARVVELQERLLVGEAALQEANAKLEQYRVLAADLQQQLVTADTQCKVANNDAVARLREQLDTGDAALQEANARLAECRARTSDLQATDERCLAAQRRQAEAIGREMATQNDQTIQEMDRMVRGALDDLDAAVRSAGERAQAFRSQLTESLHRYQTESARTITNVQHGATSTS
jgi:chromosome segregation ATPase